MTDPQMLILGPRARGRPRSVSEPMVSVGTRITTRDHDRIVKMANDARVSVSQYLRQVICQTKRDA